MASQKQSYFAYYLPIEDISGVVKSWGECERIVSGKKSAQYKKFSSHVQALEFLICIINPSLFEGEEIKSKLLNKKRGTPDLDTEGIYFDSGTGRGMGIEISVTNFQGESLLPFIEEDSKLLDSPLSEWGSYIFPPDKNYTNNFGELFALYCAIIIAIKKGYHHIYGDSKLVIDYWSLGRINKAEVAIETVELAQTVSQLRKNFENKGGNIYYISGDNNPADMGFH